MALCIVSGEHDTMQAAGRQGAVRWCIENVAMRLARLHATLIKIWRVGILPKGYTRHSPVAELKILARLACSTLVLIVPSAFWYSHAYTACAYH
eukprot:470925-Amphidinium_carterae.1